MAKKKTESRFVVTERPENSMECPLCKIGCCESTFCNPNECDKIISIREAIHEETSNDNLC